MEEENGLKARIQKRKQQNKQKDEKHIGQKNEFEQWIEQCNLMFNDVQKWLEKYDKEDIKTNREGYKGNKMMVIKVQTYDDPIRLLPIFASKIVLMSKFEDINEDEPDPAKMLKIQQRIAGIMPDFGGNLKNYRFHEFAPIPKNSKVFEIKYEENWKVRGKDLNDSLFIELLKEILGQ